MAMSVDRCMSLSVTCGFLLDPAPQFVRVSDKMAGAISIMQFTNSVIKGVEKNKVEKTQTIVK